MPNEIERKFLLSEQPAWLSRCAAVQIEQGYLAIESEVEVRLRRADEKRLLTTKRGNGEVREEIEIDLDPAQFATLWPLTGSRRLRKTRRLVPIDGGLTAEVDVFEGELEGLLIGELEFDSEEQSASFEAPEWLGKEITGDRRYAGQTLALNGLPVSRSYSLKDDESPTEGIRRIALGRAEKAIEALDGGDAGDDFAGSIHAARKDLKKLRAVVRLVRAELGDDLYREANHRYRDAGRLLSRSRDAEVKVDTLNALRERCDEELPSDLAAAWLAALERERDKVVEQASGEEGGSRVAEARTMIERGQEEIACWPLQQDSWRLVEAGLVPGYRRGRRAMKHARTDPAATNVHEWRKRTKDLWYQLQILRGAWPPVLGEMADQAHKLGDLLGDHHDLTVLAEDLRSRGLPSDRDAAERAIERRQQELLTDAFEIGERLLTEKPKAFGRRLESYWLAWRPR